MTVLVAKFTGLIFVCSYTRVCAATLSGLIFSITH